MRKIVAGVYQSLDGVIQAPGGPTEDPTGGFAHGGWVAPVSDEAMDAALADVFATPYDLLLGRRTYDIFAGYWPHVSADNPVGQGFGKAAKYVLTRGNGPLDWQNSHRLGDIDAVRALKEGDGPDLFIWGSATLYPQLFAAQLLDRLLLLTFPVVLGAGKRLFGPGTPAFGMTLISGTVTSSGVVIASYAPSGAVPTGTFPGPEPSAAELQRQARMARDDTW